MKTKPMSQQPLVPFKHPFSCLIAGPSQCGKSQFVFRILRDVDKMLCPPPERVIYYFAERQPDFDDIHYVEFYEGMPSSSELEQLHDCLIVFDDMMGEINNKISNIFTRGSHHINISIIFVVQNIFHKNPFMRTISLNAKYLVIFRNLRDNSQFKQIANQIYPNRAKYACESYISATSCPYGYLLIDLTSDQDELLRLRTNIFPSEQQVVFVPK